MHAAGDRVVVRRLVFLPVAVLGAALAVTAAAATDPHAEKKHLTKADMALASRIVPTRADLGAGWVATKPPRFDDAGEMKCPGFDPAFSGFTITGRAHSAFRHPAGALLQSAVQLFESVEDARGDFQAGAKPAVARCVATLFKKEMLASGVQARVVSTRMVASPRIGELSALYRFVFEMSASGKRISLHVDLLAFQHGRAIVVLFFWNLRRPFPGELNLAANVAARAVT